MSKAKATPKAANPYTNFYPNAIRREMVTYFKDVLSKADGAELPKFSRSQHAVSCVFDKICEQIGNGLLDTSVITSDGVKLANNQSVLAAIRDNSSVWYAYLFTGTSFDRNGNYIKKQFIDAKSVGSAIFKVNKKIELDNTAVQFICHLLQSFFGCIMNIAKTILDHGKSKTINHTVILTATKILFHHAPFLNGMEATIDKLYSKAVEEGSAEDDEDDDKVEEEEVEEEEEEEEKEEEEEVEEEEVEEEEDENLEEDVEPAKPKGKGKPKAETKKATPKKEVKTTKTATAKTTTKKASNTTAAKKTTKAK